MKKPEITVIITTYKRKKSVLEKSIKSVLNQTYKSFELIIVDDNGTSNTFRKQVEEAVSKFKKNNDIKLIQHEKNLGAQRARNNGIKNAIGKFITFLDDDDEWLEQKLELQISKFKNSDTNNLGMVYNWYNVIQQIDEGHLTTTVRKPNIKLSQVSKELLYTNFIGSTSNPMIKKECFKTVGFFDESLEAKQDYDMWIRISHHFNVDRVPIPLCNYYDHLQERISTNTNKKIKAERKFLHKYSSIIKKDKKAFSIRVKTIGVLYLREDNYLMARKYFWKGVKLKPLNYKMYALLLITIFKYKPHLLKKRI